MILFSNGNNKLQYEFTYQQIEPDVLVINSQDRYGRETVHIKSRRQNTNEFPLMTRGFHWISEHPYNR